MVGIRKGTIRDHRRARSYVYGGAAVPPRREDRCMRGLKLFGLALLCLGCVVGQESQDWTHFVRIAGHGVNLGNVGQIIRSATDTHVFGIEVDNDIPGRYESFVDPTTKLNALRAMAKSAHEAGNYAFVYIAGTECITA